MCRIVVYDTQNRLSDRLKGHLRIDKIRGNEECTQKDSVWMSKRGSSIQEFDVVMFCINHFSQLSD